MTEKDVYFILLKRAPMLTEEQRHEIAKEIVDTMNAEAEKTEPTE